MDTVSLDRLTALGPLLSEEELPARDTVRRFVADKILPCIGGHFERSTFPGEACARPCKSPAARGLHGANGISLEVAPVRHMLNLESV